LLDNLVYWFIGINIHWFQAGLIPWFIGKWVDLPPRPVDHKTSGKIGPSIRGQGVSHVATPAPENAIGLSLENLKPW